ncbi:MAG: hypothetical protein J5775_03315 [Spirochaetales bacterium]|nr:hypothetical protein [Spirochaetales bacterium]
MLLLQNNAMIAVVANGQAKRFMDIARAEGSGGGTVVPARGTAAKSFLSFFGLGDKSKELIFMVIDGDKAGRIVDAVRKEGRIQGVAAIMGAAKENSMSAKWKMITVIVNSGYTDDIMDAARKAGATGGTVMHARGTASPEDATFLGVTIVPDKEMLMILCSGEQLDAIVNAIQSLECLQEPKIGIMYIQDVTDFRNLDPRK